MQPVAQIDPNVYYTGANGEAPGPMGDKMTDGVSIPLSVVYHTV